MLECVPNVSLSRVDPLLSGLREAGGELLLDLHSDPDHNRSVFTLCSPDDPEALYSAVLDLARRTLIDVDLRDHVGVHPRIGSLDVVPFVALERDEEGYVYDGDISVAIEARDRFMAWAGDELGLPCFGYGPKRSLPEVRREAFGLIGPDTGPRSPHPTAGACAVGARPILVAYNLWLSTERIELARSIASSIRGRSVRALGMSVSGAAQVSCNLIDPFVVGPGSVYDAVSRLSESEGESIVRAELVGLAPLRVVEAVPEHRRAELGLEKNQTLEAKLEGLKLD